MKISEMRLLVKLLSLKKNVIVLLVILTIFYSLLEGLSIGLLLPVMQLAAEGNTTSIERDAYWNYLAKVYEPLGLPINLTSLLLSVMLVIFVKESIGYFQKVYAKKMESDYTADIRRNIFKKLINADIGYFSNKGVGDMVNTITTQTTNVGYIINILTRFITTFFLLVIYFFFLLIISWQMTLLSFVVVIISSLSVRQQIRISRGYGQSLVELNRDLHHFLSQRLSGIRIVKADTSEDKETEKFDNITGKIARITSLQGITEGKITLIFNILVIAVVVLIFYLANNVIRMPLANLAIFFYVLIRMTPHALSINSQLNSISSYMGSFENTLRTLKEVSIWTKIKSGGDKIFKKFEKQIEFKNVSFSYDEIPVLKNINLTIRKGEMIAIVGASGAGKSTLADLFLRLYDPVYGQITIDDVDLKEFELFSLRSKIGFVTQDIFLFNDTVEANICYGSNSPSKEEMIKAAKTANAHDFIIKLSTGYQTIVGERGVKLSGGEKQRLALARALLKKPEILILDEATSHLDSESERLIQQSLNEIRSHYTIIAIAHRLSTIEHADKIIVLKNGQILEEGTHDELLKLGGHYAGYHALQFNASRPS